MNEAISAETVARAERVWRDGASLRVVGRAALKVGHADEAWGAQQALEDGLNTADFADCGRLIVVRRLQLRTLAAGARGPVYARAIEAAWRALAPAVVAFDHPSAETAPAVYFCSRTAARLAWLGRVAESQPVGAWFWRSALPELAASLADAVPAVVTALVREAPQALAQAWMAWPAASLRRVLDAVPETVASEALRWPVADWHRALSAARQADADVAVTAGADSGNTAGLADGAASRPHASGVARPDVVTWLASMNTQTEVQLVWLVQLVLTAADGGAPALDDVAALVVQVQARNARRSADAVSPRPVAGPPTAPAATATADRSDRLTLAPGLGKPVTADHLIDDGRPHTTKPIATMPGTAPPSIRAPAATSRWPWLASNTPTAHGGLLMLLNVLRAMHFDDWLATQPRAHREALVALLFETAAARLRLPPDDPHRALFTAAALLRDDAPAWNAIDHWLRCVRRALRLQARVGLASMVQRDAGIAITATHVDVVLPLPAADLRLRRAGLDRDPGWLPWFGWIVSLHYVADDTHHGG